MEVYFQHQTPFILPEVFSYDFTHSHYQIPTSVICRSMFALALANLSITGSTIEDHIFSLTFHQLFPLSSSLLSTHRLLSFPILSSYYIHCFSPC